MNNARPHESACLHVSGEAQYVDDAPEPQGLLHGAVGFSAHAHARIRRLDLTPVLAAPGVAAAITAEDVPGVNNHGPILQDDPIFAPGLVEYVGQSVFAVLADSARAARQAARLARIEYETLPAILDIDSAMDQGSFVLPSETLVRGQPEQAIAAAPRRLRGRLRVGGQDHFYLEGQIALARPGEDGAMFIQASTQHPTEVQHIVAQALGKASKDVVVECRRMGGGFGGKETTPALFAAIAAIAAAKTGRPVKLRLDRDDDMTITGKRHGFRIDYRVGFDERGVIRGLDLELASDCGRSADLSGPVNVRAMFHSDNCYFLEHVRIVSHRCKTHKASNVAFRGFGGPQGMMGVEMVLDEIARHLGKDPIAARQANFYGKESRNTTPYGMKVEDNIIPELVDQLKKKADYEERRQQAAAFNRDSQVLKRGLALTPVKFGIAFTATFYNQAGALLHVYRDGTALLNHGGTEMGQGLYTKVAQVVAEELQIDLDKVRCTAADTSKVPNTSATAASSGSDLNGMAARLAAGKIKRRLAEFAAQRHGATPEQVSFTPAGVRVGETLIGFAELVNQAYLARVSLSATGYYRTPKIAYDPKTLRGRPFFYFAYGAAVSEVLLDALTGEHKLLRVDILHDVGESLNPAIDLGQVEGGFLQGAGWLTSEELWWDEAGKLMTHAPSTYKIPTCSDWPRQFNVELLDWGRNREDTVGRSKAVGEPPLMLAISVFHALRDAVAAVCDYGASPRLDAPATPERLLDSIDELRRRAARRDEERVCKDRGAREPREKSDAAAAL